MGRDGGSGAELPARFSRLPIFPLPDVHLFPHALLPLHVFEQRYRDLVRDALAADRLIAIAALEPGYERDYHGRPPVRAIVGVGRIVGHEALPDGRSNIVLRGVALARIERELPPELGYRLVEAARLRDRAPTDPAAVRETLVLLADQLARKLASGGDTLQELLRAQTEIGALTDVLAAALVTDAAARQALLEDLDVAARADRIGGEIATLLLRLGGSSGLAN